MYMLIFCMSDELSFDAGNAGTATANKSTDVERTGHGCPTSLRFGLLVS